MTTERTGVALRDPLPWPDLVEVARAAEATGYEALFVPEIAGREGFATLAGLTGATEAIRLATGVVPIPSRSPFLLAMGSVTVQELSGGRFILGLGSGPLRLGALDRVRRCVATVRDALAGRVVNDDGRETQLAFDPGRPPPIWLGALGDRMIALAGEIADGVLLNWCTPERVSAARRLVAEGAERAGRDPREVTVAVYIRACLGHEDHVAMAALRAAVAQYAAMPHYRRQFETMGLSPEPAEILVRAVSLVGTGAVARLQDYRDSGANLPVVYPVPAQEPRSSILGTVLAVAPSPVLEG